MDLHFFVVCHSIHFSFRVDLRSSHSTAHLVVDQCVRVRQLSAMAEVSHLDVKVEVLPPGSAIKGAEKADQGMVNIYS